MKKDDNDWYINENDDCEEITQKNIVTINNSAYVMPEHFAGLAHAILLLVDAINDKKV